MSSVLTDPARESRGWQTHEFLATGKQEIDTVFARLTENGLFVNREGAALDFGCGAGRLTQALAEHLRVAHGVDISERMVAEARRLNRRGNCHFHLNVAASLDLFDDKTFSLIYTSIVLQHMQPNLMQRYLGEFIRILRPNGVLVFQLPDRFKPARQLRRAGALVFGVAGRGRVVLACRTRSRNWRKGFRRPEPVGPKMEMHSVDERTVREWIALEGGQIKDVAFTNSTTLDFNGDLRYLADEPDYGWISKQYTVLRSHP